MRFLTFVWLFFSLSLNAQKWEWCLPAEGEDLKHITGDESGNIYVTGIFTGKIKCGNFILHDNSQSSYIAKINSSGKYIWAVKTRLFIEDLIVSNDKIYLAGFFKDLLEFNNKAITGSRKNAALLCYTTGGTSEWLLRTSPDCNSVFTEIDVNVSSDIYVTGNSDRQTKINSTKIEAGAFICSIKPSGNIRSVINLGNESITKEISIDGSGNIYVLCEYNSSLEHNGIRYEPGFQGSHYIVCYSLGKEKWFLDLGANNYYRNENLEVSSSGDFYLSRMQRYGSILLSAYSSEGILKWQKKYGGSVYDECNDIVLDNNNNLYMCGGYWYNAAFGGVEAKGEGQSMFVTKITDTRGSAAWVKSAFVGEEGAISALRIAVNNSYGYLIGRSSDNASLGDMKVNGLFIAKLNDQ